MNVVIFVTYRKRRPQYLAVCQCGTRHGPYATVALIPPQCQSCEQQTLEGGERERVPRMGRYGGEG
jgi:hypothetical protein